MLVHDVMSFAEFKSMDKKDIDKLLKLYKEKMDQMASEESDKDKVEISEAKKVNFTVEFKDILNNMKKEQEQEISNSPNV